MKKNSATLIVDNTIGDMFFFDTKKKNIKFLLLQFQKESMSSIKNFSEIRVGLVNL